MMSKKERIKRSILIIIIMVIACVSFISARARRERLRKEKEQNVEIVGNYNVDIIKTTFAEVKKENYLISPYNIEIGLNLLREGADGNTKEEIDKVIGNRKINDIGIKDKLNIANAVFIKNDYKNDVKKDFIKTLDTKYKADVLYDAFETPDVINNWVKEKTNGMIPKILDNIDKDYVMGLASALALDVKWVSPFECDNTRKENFVKVDNSKMDVEMMHQTYTSNAKYIKNDEVEGIVLPYDTEDKKDLEFVAFMPKEGVNSYITNLTETKLKNITNDYKDASNKVHVYLSLPRFTYSYGVKDFIDVLKKMGINDAFNQDLANFTKMVELDENVYVGEAIHKTKVELNENGTKAAAVTYFGMFKASAMIEKDYEEVDIKFNKPFIYMIREKNTGELLFFGTVFEPNVWKGETCSKSK
jgi:serine protease inhibitor